MAWKGLLQPKVFLFSYFGVEKKEYFAKQSTVYVTIEKDQVPLHCIVYCNAYGHVLCVLYS